MYLFIFFVKLYAVLIFFKFAPTDRGLAVVHPLTVWCVCGIMHINDSLHWHLLLALWMEFNLAASLHMHTQAALNLHHDGRSLFFVCVCFKCRDAAVQRGERWDGRPFRHFKRACIIHQKRFSSDMYPATCKRVRWDMLNRERNLLPVIPSPPTFPARFLGLGSEVLLSYAYPTVGGACSLRKSKFSMSLSVLRRVSCMLGGILILILRDDWKGAPRW